MPRKQSRIEKFTQDCISATPDELDLMLDILKGVRGKRQPVKPRATKPKPRPAAKAKSQVPRSEVAS